MILTRTKLEQLNDILDLAEKDNLIVMCTGTLIVLKTENKMLKHGSIENIYDYLTTKL